MPESLVSRKMFCTLSSIISFKTDVMHTVRYINLSWLLAIPTGFGILNLSCMENPAGIGGPGYNFEFMVKVNDTDGHPVVGIRVSVWNLLSIRRFPKLAGGREPVPGSSAFGSTVIRFDAPSRFRGDLEVFDLENKRLAALLPPQSFGAGSYLTMWQSGEDAPTGVYKCRFIARSDTSGAILFRDSIYMALYQFDPSLTVVGWTAPDGKVFIPRNVGFQLNGFG